MNPAGPSGYVTEIFRSIQGEGIYTGVMQVFIRMAGCRLSCSYCDTPSSASRSAECILRGSQRDTAIPNPVDPAEVSCFARSLAGSAAGVHSLSVTGGEPLEQPDFLSAFLGLFQTSGCPVYLETNGLEEEGAGAIAPLVDIVALDLKLPSVCGGGDLFAVYERVLPLFRGKELFFKVVLPAKFDRSEFDEAVRLAARFDRRRPFVVQPATGSKGGCEPAPRLLLESYEAASIHLDDVRVIPQCHRLTGLP